MATIRKSKQKYQVQVRKNSYQTISKTFSSLSVARSRAKVIEADIERQIYICPQDKETVGSSIERYEKELVRNQRSAESEVTLVSYTPKNLTQAVRRFCRKHGLENLHFHNLRHEATSQFFEKGLNPVEVATIRGHNDTRMLMRYTHLRAEDLVKRLG